MILHLERKFTTVTETFIINQINAINDFDVSVFTIKFLNNIPASAKIHSSEDTGLLSKKLLSKRSKLFFDKLIQQEGPELIHAHYLTDATFFHPLTKKYNIPKVCSCYGYDVSSFPVKYGFLSKYYFKSVFKEYDIFLAMSEDMRKDLVDLGCPDKKIITHYHGVNTARFDIPRAYTIRNGCFNILTVGSLEPKKAQMIVLKAIKKIREMHPDIVLKYTMVGDGQMRSKLEQFVAENNLSEYVSFRGIIKHGPEFNEILQSANVFIHPSTGLYKGDKEGIPGAIVEAMSSGLPVISTYHAGIPSVIENNQTGFLFQENDWEAMANKLISLYKDEKMREVVGKNAKKFASEHLDLFCKAKDLQKIYRKLLKTDITEKVLQ
ncbi:MAG: glycosyltransferase [Mucilaginibacter sp.]